MEQKRYSIGEKVLELLLEQVDLQPKTTADFIKSMVFSDLKEIKEESGCQHCENKNVEKEKTVKQQPKK